MARVRHAAHVTSAKSRYSRTMGSTLWFMKHRASPGWMADSGRMLKVSLVGTKWVGPMSSGNSGGHPSWH